MNSSSFDYILLMLSSSWQPAQASPTHPFRPSTPSPPKTSGGHPPPLSQTPPPYPAALGRLDQPAWAWEAAAGPGAEDPFREDWAAACAAALGRAGAGAAGVDEDYDASIVAP